MTRRQILNLMFHGVMLVLLGMIAGYIYRFALTGDWNSDYQRSWRILHTFVVQTGTLYIAIAAIGQLLTLSERVASFVVWSLVISAYTFALGLVFAPIVGTRGLDPGSSVGAVLVFADFGVSSAFGLAGAALALRGAFASLRAAALAPRLTRE